MVGHIEPAGQSEQLVAFSADHELDGQSPTMVAVAPSQNWPAGHGAQAVAPPPAGVNVSAAQGSGAYSVELQLWPAVQVSHVAAPSTLCSPGEHGTSPTAAWSWQLYPAGQAAQAGAPGVDVYSPDGHKTRGD